MGNCGSSESSDGLIGAAAASEMEERERRSRALDKELRDMERRLASQVKILLLGAGESGKTTVLKASVYGSCDGKPPLIFIIGSK